MYVIAYNENALNAQWHDILTVHNRLMNIYILVTTVNLISRTDN